MINKKFGLIVAAGILSLAACGQEQSSADDNTEAPVSEQENTAEEKTTTEASEEETEEVTEEAPEEETEQASEEEAEVTDEEPMEENSPEAMSGAASDLLSNGETTSYVFNETGEFSIFCEPHPVMQMKVVVKEGAEQMEEIAVDIADYEFGEETITVAPGTTIVWTNQDQVQHNVAIK